MSDRSSAQTSQAGYVSRPHRWKLLLVLLVAVGAAISWRLGAFDALSVDNIDLLDAWFDDLGWWAPAVFVLLWIAASVLFLPGLAITVVGGLVFGAVWGTVWTTIGANLGAAAAFLIGRYAARATVEDMVEKNPALQKIDRGVRRHGWRMLLVTRLVPIFPFNVQNYVYGLTDIPFTTYVLVTLPCMFPATIAYSFAAGSVRTGNLGRSLWYLGLAGLCFILLSLMPGWVRRRYTTDTSGELG